MSYIYQKRNVSAAKTNRSVSYSLRVLLGCRLALNASISLLLIQLTNDVEVQRGPGLAQRANGPRFCQWNVQRLTDSKLEETRSLLTRPGNEHDRLDILILRPFAPKKCRILSVTLADMSFIERTEWGSLAVEHLFM